MKRKQKKWKETQEKKKNEEKHIFKINQKNQERKMKKRPPMGGEEGEGGVLARRLKQMFFSCLKKIGTRNRAANEVKKMSKKKSKKNLLTAF